jgi:hypothetical protein
LSISASSCFVQRNLFRCLSISHSSHKFLPFCRVHPIYFVLVVFSAVS